MKPDSWIPGEKAVQRLEDAGYTALMTGRRVHYRKTGIRGSLSIHLQGVDEWALMRVEDRGS